MPQPVLKALPPLFESKDGKARDKVKELVVSWGDHELEVPCGRVLVWRVRSEEVRMAAEGLMCMP